MIHLQWKGGKFVHPSIVKIVTTIDLYFEEYVKRLKLATEVM